MKLVNASIFGRFFWNYRIYEKYANFQNNSGSLRLISTGKFAIVIQGPNIYDSDFTFETIKLYRRNFPKAILILSTWVVSKDLIKELKKQDVHIIHNQMPSNPGISNINLQIITAGSGIVMAKELGAEFVLKTRTDQRIYHPSLETYLFNLLMTFRLTGRSTKQIKRLVGISLGSLKYRMYGISDMFLYGHIDDMVRYWNISLDARSDKPEERNNIGLKTWREFSIWNVCEVYLCTEFLKNIGRDINYTLRDSFQVFKDNFVIIDQAAIKLYWHKYTINANRYADFGLFDPELTFNDWLTIYHSIDNLIVDEAILDQPISK